MAKFSYIVNNLSGGELSPRQHGRTDAGPIYTNGCYRMDNYATRSTSGVVKRKGTNYINTATGSRFIPFEGSGSISTVLGLVASALPTGAIASPAKPVGDKIAFDTAYSNPSATINEPAYRDVVSAGLYKNIYTDITDPSTSNVVAGFMSVASTFYIAASGDGSDAHHSQHVQVGDVVVMSHPTNPPIYLKYEGASTYTEYSFRDFAAVPGDFYDSDGSTALTDNFAAQWLLGTPYRDLVVNNTAQPKMTVSAVTLGNSVTVTLTNPDNWGGFSQGHIGAIFISTIAGKTGAVVITAVASTTSATGRVLRTFGGTGAIANWRESSWSNARGWPRTVTYAQGRVFFGGNASEIDRIWASQAFDIAQFAPTSLFENSPGAEAAASSTDAFSNNILSTKIQWMTNNDTNLFVGTADREYIINLNAGTSSTTLSSRPQTSYGSNYIQAIPVNNAIIFVDSAGQLRELSFNFNDDNFTAENLTDLADHLPLEVGLNKFDISEGANIKAIGLQRSPDSRVFVLTDIGGMFCITRDRLKNIASWSRVSFPGIGADSSNPTLKDINTFCMIGEDVNIQTNRVIDSSAVIYHERFSFKEYKSPILFTEQFFAGSGIDYNIMRYMDLFATRTPAGSATVTSLSHLEGQTVRCLGFNAAKVFKNYGTFTVASGNITLPEAVGYAYVGLDYEATIIPLPINGGAVLGNAQGVMKRVEEIIIRFYRTIGCKVAPCEIQLEDFTRASDDAHTASIYTPQNTRDFEDITFVPSSQAINKQLPLYTGDKSILLDSDYDEQGLVMIRSSGPYPSTIAAIIFRGETYERS